MSGFFAWEGAALVRRTVVQCGLSRVCGGCGRSLGRPVAFVGTSAEVARNEFHAPPLHTTCADDVRREIDASWEVVLTSGFDYVRPVAGDDDPAPRFRPSSVL